MLEPRSGVKPNTPIPGGAEPALTRARLTEELEEVRAMAMADDRGASAAVAAILGKAKLHGLILERETPHGELDALTPEQLALLRRLVADELASRARKARPKGRGRQPARRLRSLSKSARVP